MASLARGCGVVCLAAAVAAGCGGSGGSSGAVGQPSTPGVGQSRTGLSYAVQTPSQVDPRQTIAFQVFEPATLIGGERYPLVLHGHSLGATRLRAPDALLSALLGAGYGVISFDARGHGESGGDIQLMDPDLEGRDLVGVLDWAETHLDWLAYGPDADARVTNLVVGAVGASYGGAFQMILNAVDPKRRLDAIVPQVTWNDLDRSLIPESLPKALGFTLLSSIGSTTAAAFTPRDPLVIAFLAGLATSTPAPELHDFLRYHGERYFCDEVPLSSDGRGKAPLTPAVHPGPVHAMFFQGMRDTLFDFNEALANYHCLRAAGGDVRLLTHETGHNAVAGGALDPGTVFQPVGNDQWDRCGSVEPVGATLAFFEEHLRGHAGAASATIPERVCLSLSAGDAVQVAEVTVGTAGLAFSLPATIVDATPEKTPTVADLGFVAGSDGGVLAGIPSIEIVVNPLLPLAADANRILYLGIGQQRAAYPGIWDLVDNQVRPIRGTGAHFVDLVGIAERLEPGDRLALLIYSHQPQFDLSPSIPVPLPPAASFTIAGAVYLPLLGLQP